MVIRDQISLEQAAYNVAYNKLHTRLNGNECCAENPYARGTLEWKAYQHALNDKTKGIYEVRA